MNAGANTGPRHVWSKPDEQGIRACPYCPAKRQDEKNRFQPRPTSDWQTKCPPCRRPHTAIENEHRIPTHRGRHA